MTTIIDPSGRKSGLDDRQWAQLRKKLGPEFDHELRGWAIVESPGGRWFGRIRREYRSNQVGNVLLVGDKGEIEPAKDRETDTVKTTWQRLERVDLQPAFVMVAPALSAVAAVSSRAGDKETERFVGAAIGEIVYASEQADSFHPVEQIEVTSLQRLDRCSEAFKRKMLGQIAFAVIGPEQLARTAITPGAA